MKIDMHCHSFYSRDSICSPKLLIDTAIKKGLDGIAITDHNTTKAWDELIEYANTKNFLLILGEEIKIKENNKTIGEILAYFINKEIDPKGKTGEEIIKEIHSQGGIAIIAHPYHRKKPFKLLEKYIKIVDGIEVFNSRSQTKNGNKKSFLLLEKYDLPFVAGSDSHTLWEIGNAYIEINNIQDIKNDILNKKIKVTGKQSPFILQIFSPIAKLIYWFKSL
ncbi:MAG: PHP domain-containing protein [Candidatus Pacebacteria bacterium]|nr:PHP domain-containing protein [Candidatus Paceibacterota bacterium]